MYIYLYWHSLRVITSLFIFFCIDEEPGLGWNKWGGGLLYKVGYGAKNVTVFAMVY